ncbi:MAG: phage baseplate assembly protein V [Oligoflexales bacterium]
MIDHSFQIAELTRQLANTVLVGFVASVDIEASRVKVVVDGIESDPIPVLSQRSSAGDCSSWLPEKGEQVLILSIGGDLSFSFVIGSIARISDSTKTSSDFKRYSDGTTAQYDKKTSTLTIDTTKAKGSKIIVKANTLSVEAVNASIKADKLDINAKTLNLSGSTVKGDLTIEGALNAQSVAAQGVSLTEHTHQYTAPLHPAPAPGESLPPTKEASTDDV